jgi:hypothetical protein
VSGQEFWGIESPSDAYHVPKSWLKSFSRLGDPGMTLGRCSCGFDVFCAVHPWTVCACLDRYADCLDRATIFRLEASFVLRTVRACLPDSLPILQRTVRGSQADSPICTQILAKVVWFLCFFSSASTCASRNHS